jgi:hypothetical protein
MLSACAFELLGVKLRQSNLHNVSRAPTGKLLIADAENAAASTHSKAEQNSLCSAKDLLPERRYIGDNRDNGCARKMPSNVAIGPDQFTLKEV